ncbi:MAG: hypothetical protein ACFFG0_28690 [Candidatus Thorarchaeota archaeon]
MNSHENEIGPDQVEKGEEIDENTEKCIAAIFKICPQIGETREEIIKTCRETGTYSFSYKGAQIRFALPEKDLLTNEMKLPELRHNMGNPKDYLEFAQLLKNEGVNISVRRERNY